MISCSAVSNSLRTHGLQPARLLGWGKNINKLRLVSYWLKCGIKVTKEPLSHCKESPISCIKRQACAQIQAQVLILRREMRQTRLSIEHWQASETKLRTWMWMEQDRETWDKDWHTWALKSPRVLWNLCSYRSHQETYPWLRPCEDITWRLARQSFIIFKVWNHYPWLLLDKWLWPNFNMA